MWCIVIIEQLISYGGISRHGVENKKIYMNPKIVPTITMILNLIASIFYLVNKDVPRFVYWLSAFFLTFSVTWWMK